MSAPAPGRILVPAAGPALPLAGRPPTLRSSSPERQGPGEHGSASTAPPDLLVQRHAPWSHAVPLLWQTAATPTLAPQPTASARRCRQARRQILPDRDRSLRRASSSSLWRARLLHPLHSLAAHPRPHHTLGTTQREE